MRNRENIIEFLDNNYQFKKSHNGYEYLVYILNNYNKINNYKITDIYAEVAKVYNVKSGCIDRNLRTLFKNLNSTNKEVVSQIIYNFSKEEK